MPVLTNLRVARVFEQVADLLEAKGESPFKIQAYRRVARNLERLEEDLHLLDAEDRLTDIPGVGKEIEKKIREILRTGKLGYLERLKAELPGVLTLMEIPGIGPKTAYRLTQELGIRTIEDLEAALARGDDFWARVPRFTPHLVDNIRRGLEAYRRRSPRLPLAQAVVLFEELRNTLAQLGAGRVEPAGSLRRYEETVGDLDLVVVFPDAGELARRLSGKPEVELAETAGRGWVRARLASGLSVDLYVVDPAGFGAAWVWATGNRDHLRELEARLAAVGYRLTGEGLVGPGGTPVPAAAEEVVYELAGLPYIPPEVRDGREEFGPDVARRLARLVTLGDIRGDLQSHTDWSDGSAPLEVMAQAAADRGLEYLAISDHSAGRANARGLNAERLAAQRAAIAALNEELHRRGGRICLLAGIEVDIRADGRLDLPGEVLKTLDVVVGSLHTALTQPPDRITERLLRAIRTGLVDILGHPTARLIGSREPVDFDREEVFRAAVEAGVALEVNANPERLDLNAQDIRRARRFGARFAINTDAHYPSNFDLMRFGVMTARKAWVCRDEVVNTRPLPELREWLKQRRR